MAERLDEFLALMRLSRTDKDEFMTPERERFFHNITQRMAELGQLQLFFLDMDGSTVATCLCFDYGGSRLLYNSGYDPEYGYFSVGLLLNAMGLKDAIDRGMTRDESIANLTKMTDRYPMDVGQDGMAPGVMKLNAGNLYDYLTGAI